MMTKTLLTVNIMTDIMLAKEKPGRPVGPEPLEVPMTMLMRFDPLREFDRVFDQAWSQTRQASVPMDAYRHGDSFVIHLDLPGVDPASIDLTVERNAMTITAERHWQPVEGDQVVASERRQGTFSRQLFLGDGLDADQIHATYENGVLTVTVPIADRAKPRRIEVTSEGHKEAINAAAT
jgi:HSP20 family protein